VVRSTDSTKTHIFFISYLEHKPAHLLMKLIWPQPEKGREREREK
jgi:hypothetical protein